MIVTHRRELAGFQTVVVLYKNNLHTLVTDKSRITLKLTDETRVKVPKLRHLLSSGWLW